MSTKKELEKLEEAKERIQNDLTSIETRISKISKDLEKLCNSINGLEKRTSPLAKETLKTLTSDCADLYHKKQELQKELESELEELKNVETNIDFNLESMAYINEQVPRMAREFWDYVKENRRYLAIELRNEFGIVGQYVRYDNYHEKFPTGGMMIIAMNSKVKITETKNQTFYVGDCIEIDNETKCFLDYANFFRKLLTEELMKTNNSDFKITVVHDKITLELL